MRHYILIAIAFFLLVAAAQALPPIIIYNYTPPAPTIALVSITPTDHQQFSPSPPSVAVSFSQMIDPGRSDLRVFDPYNSTTGDAKQMSKDTGMTVALPANLLSGTYRIEWSATCTCQGNPAISGTSYFTVY